jgi:hypothetical protein
MTEEDVAFEKLKGLAKKEAARKATTGQAGTAKRVSEEAARKTATGQAGKVKRVSEKAARKAATGQAGTAKRVSEEAARRAATGQAGKVKRVSDKSTRKAASGHKDKKTRGADGASRWAKKEAAAATALEGAAAKQRQSRQVQRELYCKSPLCALASFSLAEGYMRREGNCTNPFYPASEYVQHHNWPFPSTSVDELLVLIVRVNMAIGDSRAFFCTNSEGAGHSGYHWVACIADKATRSSVANAMEDEHAAEPGPRARSMRDGD